MSSFSLMMEPLTQPFSYCLIKYTCLGVRRSKNASQGNYFLTANEHDGCTTGYKAGYLQLHNKCGIVCRTLFLSLVDRLAEAGHASTIVQPPLERDWSC